MEHMKKQNAFLSWLLVGETKKADALSSSAAEGQVAAAPVAEAPAAPSLYATSTGDEYNEFLSLMHEGKRPFRKPGITVRAEFELWLAHRAKTHAASVPSTSPSA
jgi:hypothetical protein